MSLTIRETWLLELGALKRAAPSAFGNFAETFVAYATEEMERAVTATSDVGTKLGRAQMLLSLRDDIKNLDETVQKIVRREEKQSRQPNR